MTPMCWWAPYFRMSTRSQPPPPSVAIELCGTIVTFFIKSESDIIRLVSYAPLENIFGQPSSIGHSDTRCHRDTGLLRQVESRGEKCGIPSEFAL